MSLITALGLFVVLMLVVYVGFLLRLILAHRRKIREIDDVEAINERNRMAVAMKAWETGKPVVGNVDEDGNLKIRVIE
jgi:hypothetical protein